MNILVVVDMQNDFVYGPLGSDHAKNIINNIVEYIKFFDGEIIFTKDCHNDDYLNTLEGNRIPIKHCIKNSYGVDIINPLKKYATNIIEKNIFGSISLCEYLKNINPDSITLLGLCTDICVISNAILLRNYFPNTKINIVKDCCAGVTKKSHETALEAMKPLMIDII